ncbi:hypothetical protein FA95DRAFT_1046109 [Auriscalpium vulgare]|uniref:Uncharacterized protein n=1 Tax=Auriscalpium vulgare TaxID=40419 RepID=A0ACB8S9R5_9AGAM|nr:hypothetical protein FA95DRAFT_1046109 [Auriscalpium vulgare]
MVRNGEHFMHNVSSTCVCASHLTVERWRTVSRESLVEPSRVPRRLRVALWILGALVLSHKAGARTSASVPAASTRSRTPRPLDLLLGPTPAYESDAPGGLPVRQLHLSWHSLLCSAWGFDIQDGVEQRDARRDLSDVRIRTFSTRFARDRRRTMRANDRARKSELTPPPRVRHDPLFGAPTADTLPPLPTISRSSTLFTGGHLIVLYASPYRAISQRVARVRWRMAAAIFKPPWRPC